MTKADTIFKENITKIMEEGVWSEQARPKYKDGTTANSKYITGAFAEYDLSKGEFPITTLRPIAIKSAIKEVFWIYQDQTNSLDVLEDKYTVNYWTGKLKACLPIMETSVQSVSVMERLLRSTISLTVCWHSWRLIRGTVAMSFPFGITRPSRRQQDFSLVPSKLCLTFAVWARTFIWTPL